jgi:cell shape-determining protein MreC
MQPPRISPRRIFWAAIFAGCIWAFVGGRTSAPENRNSSPSILRRTQDFAGETISTLLTPAKFIFTGIQSIASTTVDRLTAHHDATESIDSLHQTIAQLTDQLDQRDRQIRLDQEVFVATKAMAPQGLRADELLPAGVTGYQAGPGASLLTLDKGSSDTIHRGMVVTACSTTTAGVIPQASILGAVDGVWAKTCTVRLLTDPHMKMQAKLVRRSTSGSAVLTPDPCLVEGMGDGKLRCNTISVGEALAEPEVGDLMQLSDQNWPAEVQYMVIGEVTSVARKDSQLLRYDLTISPRVNLNSVQTVLVVLKQ